MNGNTVVTTVMSNLGLYKSLEREGIDYEQTAVGDTYIKATFIKAGTNENIPYFFSSSTEDSGVLFSL